MQYKVKSLVKEDYLDTILRERGISHPLWYKCPDLGLISNALYLDNIEKGRVLLHNHLENNSKIGLLVDCDCDGYTSAAIIYLFIKHFYPNIEIDYYVHEGKQHGLEDQVDNLINKNYNLIIIPDAGSNDFSQQKELNEVGTDILILDHHAVDEIDENWYKNNEHTIIINNQLSRSYLNKNLSGSGVTWQFCRFYEEHYYKKDDLQSQYIYQLMDLAAVGIIGDCMDMREYENRAFSYWGLWTINNVFLKAIVEKQAFSLKRSDKISPTGVSFFIAPLINSIVRVGSLSEKEKMFEAFINGDKIVPSTKRGAKGETERLADQMAREGANAKNRQDTAVAKAMDRIDMELQAEGSIDTNSIVIADITDDVSIPSTLNGLVAMKLADKYKKPVLIVRRNDEGFLRGSARNDGKGEFKTLRTFLLESNYFEYAQGHENAFGVSINEKKIESFLNYANDKLKDFNFNDNFYEVEYATTSTDESISDFIYAVYQDDRLWGQKNDVPLICVTNIKLTQDDLQVCGAQSDTLRFNCNGVTYIKFFASKDIEKLRNAGNNFTLTIVGEGAINEWMGRTTPQVIIKDFEIGGTIFDF